MGASLRDKILRPMTLHQARKNNLWKPQLIIVFTDGASSASMLLKRFSLARARLTSFYP